jgi:6,7-dimethyl-8-ribityllumazine synthase
VSESLSEPEVAPDEPLLRPPGAPQTTDQPDARTAEHAVGDLRIPSGYAVLEGTPNGDGRSVGVVVSRFNAEVTSLLLERALDTLEEEGVARDAVTVAPVPGAFELPLAAMALAKTRRYACIVALGAVIRGETPHFDYVAGETASGLQLAALETGVPVAFGVLTCNTVEQAYARVDRAADAVRTALEMADVFAQLRATAAAGAR